MPWSWLELLRDEAQRVGLDFLCTTYLPEDVPRVAEYVPAMKVASFEARDLGFVKENLETGKPVIVSTGMMGDTSVWGLLDLLQHDPSLGQPQHTLLHCVSAYPAPLSSVNLAWLWDLALVDPEIERHNTRVGYSDHTAHPLTGALAVAAGARVLETHIRLETTNRDNPDFAPALLARNDASPY